MKILKDLKEIFPIFNKNYTVVDSDNRNKKRFQYLADIRIILTDECTTIREENITELRVQPNLEGYGVIELNNVIRDYVQYDLDFDMTFKNICTTKNWLIYTVYFGEAYVDEWVANDFVFITPTDPGLSQLCLTTDGFSDIEHNYSVGDTINITSSDETKVKSGVWRITEIVDSKTIRLNQFWQNSGVAFDISTEYADLRRTDFKEVIQSQGTFLWSGIINDDEHFYYNENEWILGINKTKGRLITGIPDYECINCNAGYQNFTNDFDRIYFFETDNDYFGFNFASYADTTVLNIVTKDNHHQINLLNAEGLGTVGFGTGNLKEWGLNIDEDYLVYLSDGEDDGCVTTDKILMKKRTIDCSDNLVKIVFYDDMGGFSTLNFNKNYNVNTNVVKEKFDGERHQRWDYDREAEVGGFCGDRRFGDERITNIKNRDVYRVSTEFLEDEQIKYIPQLIRSKKVYLIKYDEIGRMYPYPINLINNDWTVNSVLLQRFRTFEIEFEFANKTRFI